MIYKVHDPSLTAMFWAYYNKHRLKSKNRCARYVLIHYYSTTPAPDFVKKALSLNSDIKIVHQNLYEDVL